MFKISGRLILIAAAALGLVGPAMAGLSFEITPGVATANSVWNLHATWTNSKGIWPLGQDPARPGVTTIEGAIDFGYPQFPPLFRGTTIGFVRPFDPDTGLPDERGDFYPQLLPPEGFAGFPAPGGAPATEWYQPISWVNVQPDPEPTINVEWSGDEKYDCGLDYSSTAINAPTGPPYDNMPANVVVNVDGSLGVKDTSGAVAYEGVIPPADAIQDDPATTNIDESRPATEACIVPHWSPVWLVGVWEDAARTRRVPCKLVWADELYPLNLQTGKGWKHVRVIQFLDDFPAYVKTFYVDYYYGGRRYVLTQRFPLPMPYTVYRFPAPAVSPLRIKFNPEILGLDPSRTDPTRFSFSNINRPGLPAANNPMLGIFSAEGLDDSTIGSLNYQERYYERTGGKTRLYLTTLLPPGAESPANTVWARYVQHGSVVSNTTVAPDVPGLIGTGDIKGVYLDRSRTGTNYFRSYTPGDPTITVYQLPGTATDVFIDCTIQANPVHDGCVALSNFSTMIVDFLGVYLDQNCTGTNFFIPYEGRTTEHPGYALINLPVRRVMAGGYVYLKVSTNAVDGVYLDPAGADTPGAVNYYGGAYCSKLGLIRLDSTQAALIPEKDEGSGAITRGQTLYVNYRPLSRSVITPGAPAPATIPAPSETTVGLVPYPVPPPGEYEFDPNLMVIGTDKFTLTGDNRLPLGSFGAKVETQGKPVDQPARGLVWMYDIPLYYERGNPLIGAEYRAAVSAGLNMSNPKQQPSADMFDNRREVNNKLIYDPRGYPMHYFPSFIAR